jgi:hypothetical protein
LPAVPAGNRRFLKLYLTDGRQKVSRRTPRHHRPLPHQPFSHLRLVLPAS